MLLKERRNTDDWSRLEVRWIVCHREQRGAHRFIPRLYSAAELKAVAEVICTNDQRLAKKYDHLYSCKGRTSLLLST